MFGDWSRKHERREKREQRRKSRRQKLANIVRIFTESMAYALVAKFKWQILLGVLAVGGIAPFWCMRGF